MKVLSLFDGISCARVALERAGFLVDKYYASEVDKYAIQVSKNNYPNIKHIGSVTEVDGNQFEDIDLLIGGSPCQDLSIAGKRVGLDADRSGLFWEYVRILKKVKPKYFILENVNSMPKEAKAVITEALGVEPIMINSELVSTQHRARLFWTNIPKVTQPKRLEVDYTSILESDFDLLPGVCCRVLNSAGKYERIIKICKDKKFKCLTSSYSAGIIGAGRPLLTNVEGLYYDIKKNSRIRKLSKVECERLQGLPDGYTDYVSNTQAVKAIGNGFQVDVVAHILSFIKNG